MHPLAGIYAAAVTPLKEDFSPDLEALPELLDFLMKRGCHGILVLGTTGEGPSFSPRERLNIMKAGLRAREGKAVTGGEEFRLLAGTGTPSLTETRKLTQASFDLGYDGVVVLPPYYYRKATEEGLFRFFQELIRKAVPSDGYLLGYHIPGTAGIGFTLELLERLKDAFPEQFAGIKDSSHDEDFARMLGKRFGSDLLVLTGTDSYLKLALENRAGGCITAPANLISPELRSAWEAYQRGEDIQHLQNQLTKLRHVLEKFQPFPPTLKALLAELHGFKRWPVRPPLVELAQEEAEKVKAEFKAAAG